MTVNDSQPLRDLGRALKEIGPLGTAIGAVLAAGIVYVIGGMVMLVRLHQADLPTEQALDVIPRDRLLFVGAREAIVILALSVVFGLLFSLRRSYVVFGILALVLLLFAPLTVAGAAWPILMLVLLGLSLLVTGSRRGWALLAIPILVLFVVVLRYNDPPSRFYWGNIWTDEKPVRICAAASPAPNAIRASRCGVFISIKDENVYIGFRADGEKKRELLGVPKANVKRMFLTEPPDGLFPQHAPRLSLIGRLSDRLGWPAISCNLLECWSGSRNIGSRFFG